MNKKDKVKNILERNKCLTCVCDYRIKDGNKWLCGDSIDENLKYRIAFPCVYNETCPEIKELIRGIK